MASGTVTAPPAPKGPRMHAPPEAPRRRALDVAAGHQTGTWCSLWTGDGLGGFAAETQVASDYAPHAVWIADFDGDGDDDLAAAVGFGRVAASKVASWLLEPAPAEAAPAGAPPPERAPAGKDGERGVKVKGGRDLLMQLSRCCNPVPGDRIMGYITRGRGLTIHAVGCPNLDALDYDQERLVDVEWDYSTPSTHPVKVSVVAVDKPGVLANVSSSISGAEANITRAEIATSEDQKAILDFVVAVQDTAHLERVLKAIERVAGVITARRVRSWRE